MNFNDTVKTENNFLGKVVSRQEDGFCTVEDCKGNLSTHHKDTLEFITNSMHRKDCSDKCMKRINKISLPKTKLIYRFFVDEPVIGIYNSDFEYLTVYLRELYDLNKQVHLPIILEKKNISALFKFMGMYDKVDYCLSSDGEHVLHEYNSIVYCAFKDYYIKNENSDIRCGFSSTKQLMNWFRKTSLNNLSNKFSECGIRLGIFEVPRASVCSLEHQCVFKLDDSKLMGSYNLKDVVNYYGRFNKLLELSNSEVFL